MSQVSTWKAVGKWLFLYKDSNKKLLEENPEFAQWLAEEYVPIAGGWQY